MSLEIKEVIRIATNQLLEAKVPDAEHDAKALCMFQQGYNKTDLLMHWTDSLHDNQVDRYFELVEKRAKRIPLQHILGTQEFMGLTFKVDPEVLIPRQDTEVVVEEALKLLTKGEEVLDMCSGSGAIGISIAKIGDAKVTCSDISDKAILLGEENASLNKIKVKFVKSDLFSEFKSGFGRKKYDMIISNPPYIPSGVIPTLEPEVREHEPLLALDGGEDGLNFYREIIEKAPRYLRKKGHLVFEIGYDQGESVKALLEKSGEYANIEVKKDLADNDRVIIAEHIGK